MVYNNQVSVALVVPDLSAGGGVPTVAAFLYRVLAGAGRYRPAIISLATSMRDPNSIRLLAPASWFRGVQLTRAGWQGVPYHHIGAVLGEFEFQRYRPRRLLTELLNHYDIVQVVAGTPPWALVTEEYRGIVALQVATLTEVERSARLRREKGFRRFWRALMTRMATTVEHRALNCTDAVFVENDWMFRRLTSLLDDTRVVFAPPGIDTSFFSPTTYRADSYILSVGRFNDHRKNVRLLFDAYCRFRQTTPRPPRLVLAGRTGPSPEDWAYAASHGLSEWVDIHCNVSAEQLRELYRNASLFVLSSDEEGLGIVLLEAMASALPVISTRCGGPETVVIEGETGHLTPVGDAEMLASKMTELMQNPAVRRRMGQNGRQVVECRFSLSAAAKPYLERYDALVDERM